MRLIAGVVVGLGAGLQGAHERAPDGRPRRLCGDSTEFGRWVNRGVSRRFEHNQFARVFLDRAVLEMPAYERHLSPGDLEALWAYVRWLRSSKPEQIHTHHPEGE